MQPDSEAKAEPQPTDPVVADTHFKVHLLFAGNKVTEFTFHPQAGEDCVIDLNPDAVRATLAQYDDAKAKAQKPSKLVVARTLPRDLLRGDLQRGDN